MTEKYFEQLKGFVSWFSGKYIFDADEMYEMICSKTVPKC